MSAIASILCAKGLVAPLRFTTRTANMSEVADASFGYDYTGTATGYNVDYGVTTKSLPSGNTGFIQAKISGFYSGSNFGPALGLNASGTNQSAASWAYGVYAANNTYRAITNGSGSALGPPYPAVGDIMKLSLTGTTLSLQISQDGGITWATSHTWAGVASAAYYGNGCVLTTAGLNQLASSSNWT